MHGTGRYMTLRATVKNGSISLPVELAIPDGTQVKVEILSQKQANPAGPGRDPFSTLGDDAIDLGADDIASEHDHYTYGTPKRGQPH